MSSGNSTSSKEDSKSEIKPSRARRAGDWLSREILFPVVMALLVIQFVIQAFRIPSSSMEDSLLIGDFLLGLKFTYGSPIPFSDDKFPGYTDPKVGDVLIFRYPGEPAYPDYDRERYSHLVNLLMFGNFYWDHQAPKGSSPLIHYFMGPKDFIKRCVATGGQTLEIRNGNLFVDGEQQPIPDKGKKTDYYRIGAPRDEYGPIRIPQKGENFRIDTLSISQLHHIRMLAVQENPQSKVELELSLSRDGELLPDYIFEDFRFIAIDHKTTLLSTALENYVRMQRGDTVSIPLHFSLIQDQARSGFLPMPLAPIRGGWFGLVDKVSRSVAYTHFDPTQLEDLQNNVEKLNEADSSHQWELVGKLLIDGVSISDYKLQQEAYFMMGDNRDNSSDSRYWGMLSRANVKAKAFIIYFSFDNEDQIFSFTNPLSWVTIPLKIRWSRIGKLIHGL